MSARPLSDRLCLWAIIPILILSACSSKSPLPTRPKPSASEIESKKARKLEYNRKTLVQDYLRCGQRDPKWDESALLALETFATIRAYGVLNNQSQIISEACQKAIEAGCTDPLIHYLHTRYPAFNDLPTWEDFSSNLRQAAEKMEQSGYAPVRKFYAALRTAEALKSAMGKQTNRYPEIHHFRETACNYLVEMVSDVSIPAEEIYDACIGLFDAVKQNHKQQSDFYFRIEPSLFANWPNEPLFFYLKGCLYDSYAWEGRGGGYAHTVKDEQWKLFNDRLTVARTALEQAYAMDPWNVCIPNQMIRVCMGQNSPRPEMEQWFERAMALQTNNYDACSKKLFYLEPKWHGSAEDMLEFGRKCVTNTVWGGEVPLVLADAHFALSKYYDTDEEQKAYLKRPNVWRDIKTSWDRFFEINPNVSGWHHQYADLAYQCEQWDELNRQIGLLGQIDYEFFGGREEFEKMCHLARQHGSASGTNQTPTGAR